MNGGQFWMEDDRHLDRTTDLPKDFYSTTTFTDRQLDYLSAREDTNQPFFAYLAFTAPIGPCRPRARSSTSTRASMMTGRMPCKNASQRLIELDLVPEDVEAAPMASKSEWNQMSAEERAASARKMEVYAAMVDLIDQNIGRVVDYLEPTASWTTPSSCSCPTTVRRGRCWRRSPSWADQPP